MVVGVESLVASWLIIAKDVVVTVAQDLASVKLYINVTKYMLVTVSQCLSHNLNKIWVFINVLFLTVLIIIGREKWEI